MEPQMDRIKALAKSNCPHCSKELLIEVINYPSQVAGIFSEENFKEARQQVIKAIEGMGLKEEAKTEALTWAKNEEVLFGPNEVEEIINNIKQEHGVKESKIITGDSV